MISPVDADKTVGRILSLRLKSPGLLRSKDPSSPGPKDNAAFRIFGSVSSPFGLADMRRLWHPQLQRTSAPNPAIFLPSTMSTACAQHPFLPPPAGQPSPPFNGATPLQRVKGPLCCKQSCATGAKNRLGRAEVGDTRLQAPTNQPQS